MKQTNDLNEPAAANSLLRDIQGEVSAESAPLLQFITTHASKFASVVLALLLVLGGTAVWKWYHGGKQREAREELARIESQLKDRQRDDALNALAEKAPDSAKLFILLSLAKSAQENGNPILAADAYARAAKLDKDGALGLTAALGSAGSLLAQQEYIEALALLQELEKRLPDAASSKTFQQLLAEAAARAGQLDLARKTYLQLAGEDQSSNGSYYRSRAAALTAQPESQKDERQSAQGSE